VAEDRVNDGWQPDAAYMEFAKLRSGARFNLATSGIASVLLRELPVSLDDLEITGSSAYGYEPLLDALARHLGVGTESLVLANGGTAMANHLALAGLLRPGDEVLVEEPAYSLMAAVVRYLGATVVSFPRSAQRGFRVDPEEVRRRITTRTRVLLVTNLHNPSRVHPDQDTLRALGARAREAGARVLVDEVYLEAMFEEAPRTAFQLGPEFVVTSSLTKVYGLSGLRCGWILAEPALARALWRLNDIFGASGPHTAERLSVVALGHLPWLRERARTLLAANRPLLDAFLDAHGEHLEVVRTRFGTTSFPRLRHIPVEAFCTHLREKYETTVVPGHFFGAPGHIRIGITSTDTDMVREGLARIGRALEDLRP
jgi:aspartate/methionine/tyrosine aminotransferase